MGGLGSHVFILKILNFPCVFQLLWWAEPQYINKDEKIQLIKIFKRHTTNKKKTAQYPAENLTKCLNHILADNVIVCAHGVGVGFAVVMVVL